MIKNTREGQKEIGDDGKENRRTMEMIKEEEDKSGVRKWTEKDNKEMDNMVDPYYKLQGNPQDKET